MVRMVRKIHQLATARDLGPDVKRALAMRSATVGVVVLVHQDLSRSAQAVRHWAESGCAVVVHVDRAVTSSAHERFLRDLSDLPKVKFCARQRCEWGTWGLVAASQFACEMMLANFADPQHIYLASGSCLPIRPVQDLISYLSLIHI